MSEQHHVVPIKIYVAVFLSLLILTAVTVFASMQDFGKWNTIIAVSIAVLKGTLVVLYFMHVRYSDSVVRLCVVAGFFWLAILLGLTLTDYYSRSWISIYR